jgi:hypothetical protein
LFFDNFRGSADQSQVYSILKAGHDNWNRPSLLTTTFLQSISAATQPPRAAADNAIADILDQGLEDRLEDDSGDAFVTQPSFLQREALWLVNIFWFSLGSSFYNNWQQIVQPHDLY